MNENNKLHDAKIVFLMTGNEKSGKKSIINKLKTKFRFDSEENKAFYKIFYFHVDYIEESLSINILLEIRVLNGKL